MAATDVQRAVRLGWHFAEIYRNPPPTSHSSVNGSASQHLPTFSDLDDLDRSAILISQIGYDIKTLADRSGPGRGQSAWESAQKEIEEARKGATEADKCQSIRKAYKDLRTTLGASDPRIGTALDLGQVLADTVLVSVFGDADAVVDHLGVPRLFDAQGWLDDLHTSLSEYAADAVKGSLQSWMEWAKKKADGTLVERERTDPRPDLRDQGEIWRRILCGEILAEDLLTGESYRKAAMRMLSRLARLARTYFLGRKWWWLTPSLLVIVGLAAWGIVSFTPSAAVAVAGLIAAGAGALGISWKTISSTLGKVAAKAEGPLWDVEVREAVTLEATFTPGSTRTRRNALPNQQGTRFLPPGQGTPTSPPAGAPTGEEPSGGAASGEAPSGGEPSGEAPPGETPTAPAAAAPGARAE